MKTILLVLFVCTSVALQLAGAQTLDAPETAPMPEQSPAVAPATTPKPEFDSRKMEKDLQQLPWKQARSIIEAVPKLKASVDAYGPLGWQFVEANYRQYGWKKKIDKLDPSQKSQLAELIRKTQNSRY